MLGKYNINRSNPNLQINSNQHKFMNQTSRYFYATNGIDTYP